MSYIQRTFFYVSHAYYYRLLLLIFSSFRSKEKIIFWQFYFYQSLQFLLKELSATFPSSGRCITFQPLLKRDNILVTTFSLTHRYNFCSKNYLVLFHLPATALHIPSHYLSLIHHFSYYHEDIAIYANSLLITTV